MNSSTLTKPGYLDDCDVKWRPLTEGLGRGAARITAWALEKEARYLNDDITEDERRKAIGPTLKYIFPIIRRVVPQISVLDKLAFWGDEFEHHIRDLVHREIEVMCNEMVVDGRHENSTPRHLKGRKVIRDLAQRITKSIQSFPEDT
jgi:hypothetical protein